MSAAYHIPDEPRPGRFAAYTVHPFWPLITLMLAGSWIGLPWFVVNGIAMGSASLRKEIIAAVATPFGAIAMLIVASLALQRLVPPHLLPLGRLVEYRDVLVVAVKLAFGYWIYLSQQRSFEIYRHFGGPVRQGMLIAVGATFLRNYLASGGAHAPDWLRLAVSL